MTNFFPRPSREGALVGWSSDDDRRGTARPRIVERLQSLYPTLGFVLRGGEGTAARRNLLSPGPELAKQSDCLIAIGDLG